MKKEISIKKIIFLSSLAFFVAVSLSCYLQPSCNKFIFNLMANNINGVMSKILYYLPKAITILFIVILGKTFLYFAYKVFKKYSQLAGKEVKFSPAYGLTKFFVWLLVIFASLSVLVQNIGVFLTSLGLIGFGITFALQKPILNFVGWLTLIFNRTYSIGDRIKILDVRGDVSDIELMYTELEGLLPNTDEPSGKIITVPNEMVLTSPLTNYTKSGAYVWDELEVTITYESNWQRGVNLLEDAAIKSVNKYLISAEKLKGKKEASSIFGFLKIRHIDTKQDNPSPQDNNEIKEKHDQEMIDEYKEHKPIVRVILKDSAIALNVRYLAYYKKLMAIKSDINNLFLSEIEKTDDVEIAYPHMQIVTKGKTGS